MTRTPVLSPEEAALYAIAVGSGVTTAALNTPPGSPSDGDTYIVGPSPTGAWVGNANRVAVYDAAAWAFIPASSSIGTSHRNLALGNKASAVSYRWTGAAWRTLAAPTKMLQFSDSFDPHPQYAMRGEAGGAAAVAWDDVTGKPSTFPPETHTHDSRYYTEAEVDTLLSGKQDVGASSGLTQSQVLTRGLGA